MGALPTAATRSGGSAALIGLMVVALLVLVLARIQSPGTPGATPGPSLAAVAAATVSPVATARAEPERDGSFADAGCLAGQGRTGPRRQPPNRRATR